MRAIVLAGLLALAATPSGAAGLCPRWSAAEVAGSLDGKLINEASGLEASSRYRGRLYHHNDSGDDLRFFVTDAKGAAVQVVNLAGPKPRDIEEMSLGPCGRGTCLYLGDIGDNPAARPDIAFVIVREKASFQATETPVRTVRARYPDGAHNAEAFAVHPNGDLFIVTKPTDARTTRRDPALVYRLSVAQLATGGAEPAVLEKLGELDLPRLFPGGSVRDWIITGMDISPDGKRVALLSYGVAYELAVDLAKGLPAAWTVGQNLQSIPFRPILTQQEAITWLADGSGLLFDTEANNRPTAPLMRLRCER